MNTKKTQQITLLFATFIIAICGLIYELLISTLSSYLLGDSVYQFSIVIGLFMTAMGIGAWLSRFIEGELIKQFIGLQLSVGLIGGFSAPLLFFAFAVIGNYTALLFVLIIILGSLLGIEIPLIIRILKQHFSLKTNVSNVFTVDYIGAFIAALLFPLVLMPQLGLMQSSLFIGALNIVIAYLALFIFRNEVIRYYCWLLASLGALLLLLIAFFTTSAFVSNMESRLYQDKIIYAKETKYRQRVVLTQRSGRFRLYINGALQFDSFDEYRYHESLVHPAMSLVRSVEHVLILGGGDGLAAREVLKYPTVKKITLVDLDPTITTLFKNQAILRKLNHHSLNNPKVHIVNQDAWKYLETDPQLYDIIILDLPDPNNISLSRLYSSTFYQLIKQHVSQAGVIVTQATSPLYSPKAFWCINKTLQQAIHNTEQNEDWYTLPYHAYIPSFGEWGFVLATRQQRHAEDIQLRQLNYRFLDEKVLKQLFIFPVDMAEIDVKINQLSTLPLLQYYEDGWKQWYH